MREWGWTWAAMEEMTDEQVNLFILVAAERKAAEREAQYLASQRDADEENRYRVGNEDLLRAATRMGCREKVRVKHGN